MGLKLPSPFTKKQAQRDAGSLGAAGVSLRLLSSLRNGEICGTIKVIFERIIPFAGNDRFLLTLRYALSYDYILSATDSRRSDLVDLLSSISAAVKSTDQALLKRIKQTGQLSKEESLAFLRLYKATISDLLELFSRDKDLMRMIGIEYASN